MADNFKIVFEYAFNGDASVLTTAQIDEASKPHYIAFRRFYTTKDPASHELELTWELPYDNLSGFPAGAGNGFYFNGTAWVATTLP
jgi:hypothetical protein